MRLLPLLLRPPLLMQLPLRLPMLHQQRRWHHQQKQKQKQRQLLPAAVAVTAAVAAAAAAFDLSSHESKRRE
jgi:hypothetical protein